MSQKGSNPLYPYDYLRPEESKGTILSKIQTIKSSRSTDSEEEKSQKNDSDDYVAPQQSNMSGSKFGTEQSLTSTMAREMSKSSKSSYENQAKSEDDHVKSSASKSSKEGNAEEQSIEEEAGTHACSHKHPMCSDSCETHVMAPHRCTKKTLPCTDSCVTHKPGFHPQEQEEEEGKVHVKCKCMKKHPELFKHLKKNE